MSLCDHTGDSVRLALIKSGNFHLALAMAFGFRLSFALYCPSGSFGEFCSNLGASDRVVGSGDKMHQGRLIGWSDGRETKNIVY